VTLEALLIACGVIVSIILAIREIRKDKRKVSVTCRIMGVVIGESVRLKLIRVNAVNSGHRPIVIEEAGLDYEGHRLQDVNRKGESSPLPKQISDGGAISVLFDYAENATRAFKEIQRESDFAHMSAFVRDAEGKEYKSGKPEIIKDELTL